MCAWPSINPGTTRRPPRSTTLAPSARGRFGRSLPIHAMREPAIRRWHGPACAGVYRSALRISSSIGAVWRRAGYGARLDSASAPGVVEHFAHAAGAGDDVALVVEAALLAPTRPGRRVVHVVRREAAVEPRR